MIRCTTVGREPSKLCYEICVIATKCGALKAYEKKQTMSKDFKEWEKPPKEEPQKVITTCVTVPMAILEANEREKQDERQTKDGR